MKYFKRYWNECRALDNTSAWGWSWWFFETDDEGTVFRQVKMYESGHTLRFSQANPVGEYGAISDQPLDMTDEGYFASTNKEFSSAWQMGDSFIPPS